MAWPKRIEIVRIFGRSRQGFITRITNVTFIRTVGRSQNVVHAHQVDLVFNLGFARGGLTTNEQSDPDYILDLNTIVRPLERILDQYPSQRSILENEV
jgi:hypothetical protein